MTVVHGRPPFSRNRSTDLDLKSHKVLARIEDRIAWITLNNPERRNAVSIEMWLDIGEAFKAFEQNDDVRVVVFHGAGGKSFMAGADISEFAAQRNDADAAAVYDKVRAEARGHMIAFSKPVIAMIQGFCIGGGMAVALHADIRVASEDSQFGIPAARLGLAYDIDSLLQLVAVVGLPFAKEIMLTARKFSAEEAARIGLVNRLVPADQLEPTVRAIAAEIAANAPLTVRTSKFTLDQIAARPSHLDVERIEALRRACFDSQDYAEGRTAFMEKRIPQFRGL